MTIAGNIKHALRGKLRPRAALLEIGRRGCVALRRRYERVAMLSAERDVYMAHLSPEFALMAPPDLLEHFRIRGAPKFFSGFDLAQERQSDIRREHFPAETEQLLAAARNIVEAHNWPLLGYGELAFGETIDWLRDPISGANWPQDYYADIGLTGVAGRDVRVLWELNRLGHFITLGQAYVVTGAERFAEEFFAQVESWRNQNKSGFGPNWSCAMEVALRAMNLLVAFQLFRGSGNLTEEYLAAILSLLEQHGEYIRRHLEFSYIATSNHYLSDVVGLLWLGICLPELKQANTWRTMGFQEMLREMDKQILSDGADCESSTGYHRFVLELFLYSFILCRANLIEIEDKYWRRLRAMLEY